MTIKRTYPTRICKFCNKEYTQSNHPTFCLDNPDRKIRTSVNQFTKAKEKGETIVVSEETRQKIAKANTGKRHTKENLSKISKSMQRAVKENPNSYAGGYNRGRVKSLICSNGFKVLGKWEQKFVKFCLSSGIEIQQPNTGFSYEWNGARTYFPDFYLPESDQWVEIKGYETERDRAKWDSLINVHKKNLKVIKQKEMKDLNEWLERSDLN